MHIHIHNEREIGQLFSALAVEGAMVAPRGATTLELENLTYTTAPYVRYNTYKARGLKLDYIKREIAWYIKADRGDLSIAEYAKMWGPMVKDGILNSCYGFYWFRRFTGVASIIRILREDPDSRRAVIPMYGTEPAHHDVDVRDVPCTTSVEFRIRDNLLNVRFIMRSQDAVLGMGNDLPTFSFLQEVVARLLGVELGTLTVAVGSFHVYERHFPMLHEIIARNPKFITVDEMPKLTKADAEAISKCHLPLHGSFSKWLGEV